MKSGIDLPSLREHSKLFALLSEEGQKRMLDVAEEERFDDGAVLMKEGDVGDTFYVLLEGHVRVFLDNLGQAQEVARLGPGSFVGEMAALLGEARSATVIADGALRVLRFEAGSVKGVLDDYPKVREALVKLALKRSEDNLQSMLETGDFLVGNESEDGDG